MTLRDLLSDEALRQQEFPVVREKVFLSHAAVCPLPRRATAAMEEYLARASVNDQELVVPEGWMGRVRERAARLIGARAEEIALVGPTSLGLSFVAEGLTWQGGDNVVLYHEDYPSNVYPWMALAARGVEVRFLRVSRYGQIELEEVAEQVDERTRLVALPSCHFISGFRLDVAAIGRFLHARGILFCVDGIQTLGAFATSVEHVDFLAADAHKWMLGPCAAGVLFVRKELQERLAPRVYGWHNVRCPGFIAQDSLVFRQDARRYEAGTANLVGLVGLDASLELLGELGADGIAEELLRKRAWLVAALREKGYTVLAGDVPRERASGIVSFFRQGIDLAALHRRLGENGVVASLRRDRTGREYVRFSAHAYNTDDELHRALKLL